MKKLLLLLLFTSLLPLSGLRAQTTDSLRLQLDRVFAPLDRSQVPTGLLDAYAHPLVPLAPFDGVLQDSVSLNPTLFRALYATAYTGWFFGPNPLPTLQSLNAAIDQADAAAGPATRPVMMQLLNYASIRPDARSLNLLRAQNQQVFDVPGRSQSPYLTKTLFAAAPTNTFFPTGQVSLVFPSALFTRYLSAQAGAVLTQQLAVDFGDGRGYLPASFDQPIGAAYTSAGTKQVKVRYAYQLAASQSPPGPAASYTLETRFEITVDSPAPSALNATNKGGLPTAFVKIRVDDSVFFPAQNGRASGWALIRYGAGHTRLTKPLIVAKGFDGHFVAKDIYPVNYSIRKFVDEIKTSNNLSIFNFRDAIENVGGYDIVFINYTNGTEDIYLNAGLFEAVLNYVNQQKDPVAREPNVVLGLSMGGNIARYKLAEMTKAGRRTDVRLLLLNDSPQRGANIPLGLSALVRQLQFRIGDDITGFNVSDMVPAVKQANTLLDSPAARQLLLYQTYLKPIYRGTSRTIIGYTIEYAANTFIEGDYRQMISYQAPYRIVAVSQGSQCGNGLFAPYTELIRATGGLNLFNLPFFLAGSSSIQGEVVVNAIPAGGQVQRVSSLQVVEQTSVFFGLIKVTNSLARRSFPCPPGLLPLDGAAGGTVGIGSRLGYTSGIRGGVFDIVGSFYRRPYTVVFSLVSEFNFVPTPSGLDMQDFTSPSLYAKYINGASTQGVSRVDNFLAQESFAPTSTGSSPFNQAHVSFTPRNGQWMFNEMQRTSPTQPNLAGCTTECALPIALTGDEAVCPSKQFTLGLQSLPPDASVRWSISPAGSATPVGGSTGATFTAQAPGTLGTLITVEARVTTACGVQTLTRTVPVSLASISTQVDFPPGTVKLCPGTIVTVRVVGTNLRPPYFWTQTTYFNGQPRPPFTFTTQEPYLVVDVGYGPVDLTVTALDCDGQRLPPTDRTLTPEVDPNGGFYCDPYSLRVFPNPANELLTVSALSASALPPGAAPAAASSSAASSAAPLAGAYAFEAQLLNGQGQPVAGASTLNGELRLTTAGLRAGLYHLIVRRGRQTIYRNISVGH